MPPRRAEAFLSDQRSSPPPDDRGERRCPGVSGAPLFPLGVSRDEDRHRVARRTRSGSGIRRRRGDEIPGADGGSGHRARTAALRGLARARRDENRAARAARGVRSLTILDRGWNGRPAAGVAPASVGSRAGGRRGRSASSASGPSAATTAAVAFSRGGRGSSHSGPKTGPRTSRAGRDERRPPGALLPRSDSRRWRHQGRRAASRLASLSARSRICAAWVARVVSCLLMVASCLSIVARCFCTSFSSMALTKW